MLPVLFIFGLFFNKIDQFDKIYFLIYFYPSMKNNDLPLELSNAKFQAL